MAITFRPSHKASEKKLFQPNTATLTKKHSDTDQKSLDISGVSGLIYQSNCPGVYNGETIPKEQLSELKPDLKFDHICSGQYC